MTIRQAVILSGGLGTRLRPLTNHLPKPMAPVLNRPFLHHLLDQLHKQGITDVVLLTGYLKEVIRRHFGEKSPQGLNLTYGEGPTEWNTAKRLNEAKGMFDKTFLLLYGDNYAPFSLQKLWQTHQEGWDITLSLSPKSPGNIKIGQDGQVQSYAESRSHQHQYVEIGYMIVNRKVLDHQPDPDGSFSRTLEALGNGGTLGSVVAPMGYHSISDPERLKLTEEFLRPKKIILVDRDGVINRKAPRGEYITRWEDFEFLEDNIQGLQYLANQGYQFVLISNQAGIGRKVMTREQLDHIHHNMVDVLKKRGIDILDIFVCPHHWEDDCSCRKPKPGMLYKAAQKFQLKLDDTFFIGDDPRDCQAAYQAQCKSIYIGDQADTDILDDVEKPSYVFSNIFDGRTILSQNLGL